MRYVLLVLLLAGCASQPTVSIFDEAAGNCRAYGVPQDQWSACMQREVASLRQQDAARAGMAMQYLANQPQSTYQPVPFTPTQAPAMTPYRAPVQCRSIAGVWTCQ